MCGLLQPLPHPKSNILLVLVFEMKFFSNLFSLRLRYTSGVEYSSVSPHLLDLTSQKSFVNAFEVSSKNNSASIFKQVLNLDPLILFQLIYKKIFLN